MENNVQKTEINGQTEKKECNIPKLSRRQFLQLTGAAGLLLAVQNGFEASKIYSQLKEQLDKDYEYARRFSTPEAFFKENQSWLSQIEVGWNFRVSHMLYVSAKTGIPFGKGQGIIPEAIFVADVINEKLAMTKGRLGIRLSEVLPTDVTKCNLDDPQLNMDFYRPWLDQFQACNQKLYISPGIKSPGWPEIHIPNAYIKKIYQQAGMETPNNSHLIHKDDPLAKFALKAMAQVYQYFQENYPNLIAGIVPENEHNNKFGPNGRQWLLADDYLILASQLANHYFPDVPIIMNCPGTRNTLRKTIKSINIVSAAVPKIPYFIAGINSYHMQPYTREFGDNYLMTRLNDLFWLGLFMGKLEPQIQQLDKRGNKVIITEAQAEPWYNNNDKHPDMFKPGNDFQFFCFFLIRMMRYWCQDQEISDFSLPNYVNERVEILLWGIEELTRHMMRGENDNYTMEHEKIIRLINMIGAQNLR
ncbi:twin-arginine translocation signal domain-containing protein [Candidatus Dojkabacteria bacterium]|nr:twin-arginine translocation signal domain-containing protein [Candidatus Dojkabacteria bacterium]